MFELITDFIFSIALLMIFIISWWFIGIFLNEVNDRLNGYCNRSNNINCFIFGPLMIFPLLYTIIKYSNFKSIFK